MTHKTQRIETSFHKLLEDLNFLLKICLIELNLLEKKDDSKNWFLKRSIKYRNFILMTQRIIDFFFEKTWLTELNHFFHVTHGIEPFFPTWLIVIEPLLFYTTQRIEPFFEYDSKNWKFSWFFDSKNWIFWRWLEKLNFFSWMWLTELNFFFFDDSKNCVLFFSERQRFCWIRLKESNLFL